MKTALIIVDMINDFVNGKLGCQRALTVIQPIKKLIIAARQKGIPVIYTNDAHHKNKDSELLL
jgi:nicotinamidase-related amidase